MRCVPQRRHDSSERSCPCRKEQGEGRHASPIEASEPANVRAAAVGRARRSRSGCCPLRSPDASTSARSRRRNWSASSWRSPPHWFEWNRIALVDVSGFIESEAGFWTLLGGTSVADVQQKLQARGGGLPRARRRAADQQPRRRGFRQRHDLPGSAALQGKIRQAGRRRAHGHRRLRRLLRRAFGRPHRSHSRPPSPARSASSWTLLNIERLYGKIGLRSEVIKSGEKKDIGSATRKITDEERAILQGVNRALFDRFLDVVRAGRPKMDAAQRTTISDGRVFTAQEALQLNLVDSVGYLSDAIAVGPRPGGHRARGRGPLPPLAQLQLEHLREVRR